MGLFRHLPPRPAPARVAFWVALVLLVRTVLLTAYLVLGDRQRGQVDTLPLRLVDEMTGAHTALPLLAVVAWAAARWPVARGNWRASLLPLSVVFLAFSIGHTLAMETSRWLLYPLIGATRAYSAAALRLAVWHELPMDLFNYATFVAAIALWRFWWQATERERRDADLRRALVEAQLSALRLQMQPHFLFNALNTVSATMYDDPKRADAMLGELSELLRASLRTSSGDTVPLREELNIATRYVRLQRERFGDRLDVSFDVPDDCLGVAVPILVLQPLIENAVRHGRVERLGKGTVRVVARRGGDHLSIDVWDDGGDGSAAGGTGLGLRSIEERLRLLHGDAASFNAGAADGGWKVRVTLPRGEAR